MECTTLFPNSLSEHYNLYNAFLFVGWNIKKLTLPSQSWYSLPTLTGLSPPLLLNPPQVVQVIFLPPPIRKFIVLLVVAFTNILNSHMRIIYFTKLKNI